MSCDEMKQLLDAYIDDELSQAQTEVLYAHAQGCKSCRQELKAAELLKDTLAHMDDDIDVPLQAQAAWRSAVRAEAAGKRRRTWMRYGYALAAVLVLALGFTFAFEDVQHQPEQMLMARGTIAENDELALIAADGGEEAAAYSMDRQTEYSLRSKLEVASVQQALESIELLAAEYSGSFTIEGDTACIVHLPADYLQDFIKACESIGTEVYSESMEQMGESAAVFIQLSVQ